MPNPIPTILVVDDEPSILRGVTTALAGRGYEMMVAENGSAALNLYLADPDRIDLIITDVVMPVMGGLELAKKVLEIRPEARILLMTGYADVTVDAANSRTFPVLRKPFLPDRLRDCVRKLLDGQTENRA